VQVINDMNVWLTATFLINFHGAGAAIVASQWADDCKASGDIDFQRAWKRVVLAIAVWQRTSPAEGERVN
jgi:anti-sigma factor RsiW